MLLQAMVLLAVTAAMALGGSELLVLATKARAQAAVARFENVAARQAIGTAQTQLAAAEAAAVAAGTPYAPLPALDPMATTPLCDPDVPCGFAATASYSVDGSTDMGVVDGADVVTAPNVEAAAGVWERRVALTMTVDVVDAEGAVVHVRPQRVKFRLWAPGNAEPVEAQDADARANRVSPGAAENEGCAVDGTGCDAAAVTAVDPTTLDARAQCVDGYGSGECAPGELESAEDKQSIPWTDPQAVDAGP